MKKVYVIGSINTDLVISAPYLPKSGETLSGSGFFTARGGKGANQAVAAARLGGKVIMCGCVGDDAFGKEAISVFEKEGIDVSHIRTVKDVPTGTAVIVVVDGDNRIILDKGANACVTKTDVDETLAGSDKGDILLVQLEIPIEVVGYALKTAKEKGLYVILNPAPADVGIKEYLQYCDLAVPNETESEILGGKEALNEQVKGLIVTMGGKGFEICDKDKPNIYPCNKITPVDTTAAGDTFCGGLAAKLAQGYSLTEAAKFGSMAATVACMRKGAQTSIPTIDELTEQN